MLRLELEKRLTITPWIQLKVTIISIAIGLLFNSLLLLFLGFNPVYAYAEIFLIAFGSIYGIASVLIKVIPLLLIALGLAIAFKAKTWNIGAPGQMTLGSITGAGVALFLSPYVPTALVLPLMFTVGFSAGAGLAIICAFLKIKVDLNMVISTLLLNYVVQQLLSYLIYGPWQAGGLPHTKLIPPATRLPTLGRSGIPYPTLFLALAVLGITYFLLSKSKLGYEIRAFGESREAAKYAGISNLKITMVVMILSGGLAGLAGVGEVAGVHHALKPGITGGGAVYGTSYGYTAVFIAWLGRNHPLGVLFATFFVAIILIGGQGLQLIGIPYAAVIAILGLMLLTLMAGGILVEYRVKYQLTLKREKAALSKFKQYLTSTCRNFFAVLQNILNVSFLAHLSRKKHRKVNAHDTTP